MKLKVMPGRIVVKQRQVKLKGTILIPPNRMKLYEIGEIVALGDLCGYGPEGKTSTNETYAVGELVLFQLPAALAGNITFDIKGTLHCFLHVEDIIARISSDTISFEGFAVVGRFVLLEPSVRHESIIVLPDSAEQAKSENLHFSVLQAGKDVKHALTAGQEVFPDKGRVNPINIERKDYAFIDQQSIYGALCQE